jgi:hypothetical protein
MINPMTDSFISEFKELYLKTAEEYLQTLAHNYEALGTAFSEEIFQKFFMASHSLKSQSLAMNYSNTGTASRTLEIFSQTHLKTKTPGSPEEIIEIKKIIDFIQFSLSSIRQTGHEQALSEEENNMLLKIQNE